MNIFKISFKTYFLKAWLVLTAFFSILIAISPSFLLQELFGLSQRGWKEHFFWQLLTFVFILPESAPTIGFLLRLALTLYLIWTLGGFIERWKGPQQLFFLFLGTTVLSAVLALFLLPAETEILFGSNLLLCSLAFSWLNLRGDAKIYFFTVFQVKVKWLVATLLAFLIAYNFIFELYLTAFLYFVLALFGYFYALFVWHSKSPFLWLAKTEGRIIRFQPGLPTLKPDQKKIKKPGSHPLH
ncbi:MAG: hypothetical protein WC371_03115 [Parachlamydiales bacterium]|jgi:hypothetical protein